MSDDVIVDFDCVECGSFHGPGFVHQLPSPVPAESLLPGSSKPEVKAQPIPPGGSAPPLRQKRKPLTIGRRKLRAVIQANVAYKMKKLKPADFSLWNRGKQPTIRHWRHGQDTIGRFTYSNLRKIPPCEVDADGMAIAPPYIGRHRQRCLTEVERKVRFVMMWNYTGGIVLLACQEAGILRSTYEGWLTDPLFKWALSQAKKDILDRLKIVVHQCAGIIPRPESMGINYTSTLGLYKVMSENQEEEGDGQPDSAETYIPRPSRPS